MREFIIQNTFRVRQAGDRLLESPGFRTRRRPDSLKPHERLKEAVIAAVERGVDFSATPVFDKAGLVADAQTGSGENAGCPAPARPALAFNFKHLRMIRPANRPDAAVVDEERQPRCRPCRSECGPVRGADGENQRSSRHGVLLIVLPCGLSCGPAPVDRENRAVDAVRVIAGVPVFPRRRSGCGGR